MKPVDEDRPQPTAERPDPMVVLDGGQPDRDDTKNFPNEVVRVVTWNPTATKPKPKPKPKAGPRPKKAAAQQNQSTHGSPQEFSDGLLVPCPD